MAGRSGTAARRRTVRAAGGAAVLVGAGLAVLDWRLLSAVVAAGILGAVAWWAARTHRSLRARDREFRREDQILDSHRKVADLERLSPEGFELAVAALLRRDGCEAVRRIGGAGDHGVDVVGRLPDGRSVAVQCKRYAPHRKISSSDMIRLLGSQRHYRADVAVFVTTTRITEPAEAVAVEHGILAIHRDHLGHWRHGASITSFLAVNGGGRGRRGHLRRWQETYRPPGRE